MFVRFKITLLRNIFLKHFSPNVILCGWLGSKHQLTNKLWNNWLRCVLCTSFRDVGSATFSFYKGKHRNSCRPSPQQWAHVCNTGNGKVVSSWVWLGKSEQSNRVGCTGGLKVWTRRQTGLSGFLCWSSTVSWPPFDRRGCVGFEPASIQSRPCIFCCCCCFVWSETGLSYDRMKV